MVSEITPRCIISLFTYLTLSHILSLASGNIPQVFSPLQNTANLTVDINAHCTTDESWLYSKRDTIRYYYAACQVAVQMLYQDPVFHPLMHTIRDSSDRTEFEFLDQNAAPQTIYPKIRLPRKYTFCKFSAETAYCLFLTCIVGRPNRPPCTIAIAMIASLIPGNPLPGQPVQRYGLSDVMTPRELVLNPDYARRPLLACILRMRNTSKAPALGWTQAGKP